MSQDKERPTQKTQPKEGEPIDIPVPTRDEIDAALQAVAKPQASPDRRVRRKRRPKQ